MVIRNFRNKNIHRMKSGNLGWLVADSFADRPVLKRAPLPAPTGAPPLLSRLNFSLQYLLSPNLLYTYLFGAGSSH